MAFFDDLKGKVSKTGQDAMQKTRNLADATKLSMENTEIEKSNKDLYVRIGEYYYEKYKDLISDEEIVSLVGEIDKNQEKIRSNKTTICQLKGVQQCPNCGAEMEKTITFCSKCGAKMPEWIEPEPIHKEVAEEEPIRRSEPAPLATCPGCGSQIRTVGGVCPICGTKVSE